jgi:Na+/proline symporter
MIFRDGFPYAFVSFYAIAIPLTGVLFLKRQWILGKRFGYITQGEMLSDYYRGNGIRLLTVIVGVLFTIPYLALQLLAAGYLFQVLTDGFVPMSVGMTVLAMVMVIYVATGGLRAVAYVETMQCLLLAFGLVATGLIALNAVGGWEALGVGLAGLAKAPAIDPLPRFGESLSYFSVPGMVQFTGGAALEVGQEAGAVTAGMSAGMPVGGLWTGVMVFTFILGMMGVQAAPAFSMWAFGNPDPRPFAPQQVWASSLGIGLILVLFTAMQGMGGHLLGADPRVNQTPELWEAVKTRGAATPLPVLRDWGQSEWDAALRETPGLRRELEIGKVIALQGEGDLAARRAAGSRAVQNLLKTGEATALTGATFYRLMLPEQVAAQPDTLVPHYFNGLGESMPWLIGLLAVCALAAMQSTGAAYLSTAGSIVTRDLYKRFLDRHASHERQKRFGRLMVILLAVLALLVAHLSTDTLVVLGGMAVGVGLQMWLALVGICWFPWFTRQGVTWGLVAGLTAALFTDAPGLALLDLCGLDFWGRWPLTLHSAGWGLLFNAGVCFAVSAFTQEEKELAHRASYHAFLSEHAAVPARSRPLIPAGWGLAIVWGFFAIGPGIVIGDSLFGVPDRPETWIFGIPSIWAWQIVLWAVGVLLMWLLAFKLGLSTVPEKEIEALLEDIGESDFSLPPDRSRQ